jgi:hypothetical protein
VLAGCLIAADDVQLSVLASMCSASCVCVKSHCNLGSFEFHLMLQLSAMCAVMSHLAFVRHAILTIGCVGFYCIICRGYH